MEIEIDRLLGLPAHPLLVHAAVVLVPLSVAGALVCVVSPRWRRQAGWLVVAAAALTVVAVQLAIGSGEALEDAVRDSELIDDHAGMADTLLPLAGGFFVALTGLVGTDVIRRRRQVEGQPGPARLRVAVSTLAVLTVLTAALSMVWTFRAGHSGAKAVWDDPQRPMLEP